MSSSEDTPVKNGQEPAKMDTVKSSAMATSDDAPAKNDEEHGKEKTASPLYQGDTDNWGDAKPQNMRISMLRSAKGNEGRRDKMQQALRQKRASMHYVMEALRDDTSKAISEIPVSLKDVLSDSKKKQLDQDTMGLKEAAGIAKKLAAYYPGDQIRVGIRLKDFSYEVNVDPNTNEIQTVYNQSCIYAAITWWKIFRGKQERPKKERKFVLKNVNLNFQPGKMYLILGPPLSGKTTLLKAIAGRLPMEKGETKTGTVEYNGLNLDADKGLYVDNMIAFVGQTDFHAPRLTVQETFDFAFQCKSGGTHVPKQFIKSDEQRQLVKKLDDADAYPKIIEKVLGLDGVANTFVGNNDIRGVSGGQRRRVTTGEMVQAPFPILCADELSTGLDSSSTFSICSAIMHFTQVQSRVRVLSLLQPSPETVALFDEIILLTEGKILFAGPVSEVEDYFAGLGYRAPDYMDIADFCQVISTPDGAALFNPSEETPNAEAYTVDELAEAFVKSDQYQKILEVQKGPWVNPWGMDQSEKIALTPMTQMLHQRYRNSGFRNLWLNLCRELVIWSRDKRFLIANGVKNVIMGISVGGVFYQTDNIVSIYGVLFQLNLFIMLGAMTSAPALVDDRIIYYRHYDANFYGAFAYAFGKAFSLLPQSLTDVLIFATICYFMVGLTTAASNYFIFIAILFVFSFVMNQQLAIFTAVAENKSGVSAGSSVILLFFLVFCGFLVTPVVIPNYYIWIYWWNPLAWTYRALLVNEFRSSEYDGINESTGTGLTYGETALEAGGMIYKGEAFEQEWVAYSFAYLVPYAFLCTVLQAAFLRFVRVEPKASPSPPDDETEQEEEFDEANMIDIPFKPVTLSFTDICYDVTASKGKDTLRLLNSANGIFKSGRMLALMGSSGAGKTTLMDVIALRKTTGTITGDVRLNGYEQEKVSFRRCSGYVEQFDVQSPQLTVRETVLFSARLRLNSEDPAVAGDDIKQRYTEQVLRILELTALADSIVGMDGQGGLSFEQRKRLSIAVELAASPSIIFLDEPTSGLDSRAAMLVVKILRKIADQGRTVVATIHQPSSSVFEMFDDLLLLKKGGRTVFFGELGDESCNLVQYFESRGARPIDVGENPADWMLTVITSEAEGVDYVEDFLKSQQYETMQTDIKNTIEEDGKDPDKKITFSNTFAASRRTRSNLLAKRLRTIYWRSPAYNLLRMVVSVVIAFVLGSIFITNRLVTLDPIPEQQMSSILSVMFISFIIIGVMSINAVLPVMGPIRDNFYRQRAAGMYGYWSLGWALGSAEKWFIILSSALFCVVFLPCVGVGLSFGQGFGFWGFFTFNLSVYSYFGQAFVACVPTVPTAQILAAVFIGLNNFFSGLIVRPQYLSGFFEIPYWITPGHYVYEGMVLSAFHGDNRAVLAETGSAFYNDVCGEDWDPEQPCISTVEDFIDVFFGGKFQHSHLWYDIFALAVYLISARVLTFFALKHFNYTGQ